MEKPFLAIFDLDGTLFDTDDINYRSYSEAISEVGREIGKDRFLAASRGKDYREFLPAMLPPGADAERVHDRKKKLYHKYLDRAAVNAHLARIIEGISDRYHIAMVTTASGKNAREILGHRGLEKYFELVLAKEDVPRLKPDPMGFLMAMERFGIKKENTVIFEDSDAGIRAAMARGASVLKVERF